MDAVIGLLLTAALLYTAAGLWHRAFPKTATAMAADCTAAAFAQRQGLVLRDQSAPEGSLAIPVAALHTDDQGSAYVYISHKGLARKREVTVLAETEDVVLVVSHQLQSGDKVIVRAPKLYEGMPTN